MIFSSNLRIIIIFLFLIIGILCFSFCNAIPKTQGTIEDVTSVQVRPLSLSLAVNEGGNPWISFYSLKEGESDGKLMVVTKEGGKWAPSLVDNVGNVGLYSSIVFDNLNVPWIAYYDVTNKSVLVAYPVPSYYDDKNKNTINPKIIKEDPTLAWVHEGVFAAQGADVGKYIQIAFDNKGEPGISAYDSENKVPMFFALSPNGIGWIPHFPSQNKETGEFTSLTFDNSNEPWISYVDNKNRDLIVSHKTGKTWDVEVVDSAGEVGAYNSIATNPNGNIAISYYDYTNGGLKYATRVGDSWKVESVWKGISAVSGEKYDLDVGAFSSLVFDKQGNPYITFYAASTGELMGATKVNGEWNIVVIDSPKEKVTPNVGTYQGVGSYSSAKLLPSGDKIGVTYYDWDKGVVKYAEIKTSEFSKSEQQDIRAESSEVPGTKGLFNPPKGGTALSISSTVPGTKGIFNPPKGGTVPLEVIFMDQSTGNPTTWNWNFGDGNASIEQNPTHTYTKSGKYKIDFETCNENGCKAGKNNVYISVCEKGSVYDNSKSKCVIISTKITPTSSKPLVPMNPR